MNNEKWKNINKWINHHDPENGKGDRLDQLR
jgi:hypothetical protein